MPETKRIRKSIPVHAYELTEWLGKIKGSLMPATSEARNQSDCVMRKLLSAHDVAI